MRLTDGRLDERTDGRPDERPDTEDGQGQTQTRRTMDTCCATLERLAEWPAHRRWLCLLVCSRDATRLGRPASRSLTSPGGASGRLAPTAAR